MVHQRSKHIDIKFHFVRSIVSEGIMDLIYVPTAKNIADVFTKPIASFELKKFIAVLMGI